MQFSTSALAKRIENITCSDRLNETELLSYWLSNYFSYFAEKDFEKYFKCIIKVLESLDLDVLRHMSQMKNEAIIFIITLFGTPKGVHQYIWRHYNLHWSIHMETYWTPYRRLRVDIPRVIRIQFYVKLRGVKWKIK